MDFTFTSDQQLVRDSARTLFAKECPTSLVRAHMEDPRAAQALWKIGPDANFIAAAALGAMGTLVYVATLRRPAA